MEGKRGEERQWKNREKPFRSAKDSDRKPPICGQTAGGQTEWTLSAWVCLCVCRFVVSRWGWKRKAKSPVWNAGCLRSTSYPGHDVEEWEQTINLLEQISSKLGTISSALTAPTAPTNASVFSSPCCICQTLPFTAPQVCVEDEKYWVYKYMAHWQRPKLKQWPCLLNVILKY